MVEERRKGFNPVSPFLLPTFLLLTSSVATTELVNRVFVDSAGAGHEEGSAILLNDEVGVLACEAFV